jgi:hypothetical protein
MALSRRDPFKIGIAGGAAMPIPFQRGAFSTTTAVQMPTSALPLAFSLPFKRPPEVSPTGLSDVSCDDGTTRSYPRYDLPQTFTVADILPGYKTPLFTYNGVAPGPTIRVHNDAAIMVDQTNLPHQPAAPHQDVPMPSRSAVDSVYFGSVTVPADHVFVLGDDRASSRDSRVFGPVPTNAVQSRIDAVIWPMPPTREGLDR